VPVLLQQSPSTPSNGVAHVLPEARPRIGTFPLDIGDGHAVEELVLIAHKVDQILLLSPSRGLSYGSGQEMQPVESRIDRRQPTLRLRIGKRRVFVPVSFH